jgi:hypothetical protein
MEASSVAQELQHVPGLHPLELLRWIRPVKTSDPLIGQRQISFFRDTGLHYLI